MENSPAKNIFNNTCLLLYQFLIKPSRVDGRVIIFGFLSIYFASIFLSSYFMDYTRYWRILGVPSARPLFGDLFFITKILNCHQLGLDIYKSTPCSASLYCYPKLWLYLSPIWVKPENNGFLAIVLVSLYYFVAFIILQRTSINEGIYYGLLLCSPPLMLAVERGNPDLIIFILCGIAIWVMKKKYSPFVAASLLLICGFLKLYPFTTIISFLKDDKKKSLWLSSVLLIISIVYIILTYDTIKISVLNIQSLFFGSSVAFCHGYLVIFKLLNTYPVFNHIFNFFPYQLIALAVVILLLVLVYFYSKKNNFILDTNYLFAFRVGALLYAGSFMCGQNFDYKFIMFIFTIPQLLSWLKNNEQIRGLTLFALVSILISCWSVILFSKLFYFFIYTTIEELLNWYIFAYFTYVFLLTLPGWLKGYLFIKAEKPV